MQQWIRYSCLTLAFLLIGGSAHAQQKASSAYPSKGFRLEFLRGYDQLEKKFVSLAEAFPEGKYSWRPGEGVRSVSEVFGHVAEGNYGYSAWLGVKVPESIHTDDLEKMTDKMKLIEVLKKSFEFYRQAVLAVADGDLENPVKMMNREGTVREALLFVAAHQPEHLGQLIAYARMNNVVPPWTAARQQQLKK